MKTVRALLYLAYNILLFTIAVTLLLGIAAIAELSSWYYLLLYVPFVLFIYQSEAVDFRKKKHAMVTGKKKFHR
jgi:4-hydroxybenzoate polyprenyltransferase